MSVSKYLDTLPLHDIIKYQSKENYSKDCVFFTGAPKKHPYDVEKILLVSQPFSSNTIFFEFLLEDILHVEDIPGIATDTGENLTMVKLWVRKGSMGMKYEPFEVDEPLRYFKDSELLHQVMAEKDSRR